MSTYIIAEAGVNHNGQIENALKLIVEAKNAGADCVKFQTFKTEEIVTLQSPKADYQLKVTDKSESQFEMLKKLELSKESFHVLKNKCDEIGIDFMSTPYSLKDIELLENIGVSAYKIASGQLTEHFFLKKIAEKKKPMILSSGMSTLSEVFNSVQLIKKINKNITVLQCTTNYPSDIEDANILAMVNIKNSCGVDVGYSDHVTNNYACYTAVSLGAKIIEKHFTLDKNMEGPDHSSSLNPIEFKELVNGIRNIEKSLGNGIKLPTNSEIKNTYGMRRSIVAIKNIQKNSIINISDIGVKRPLNGIPASRLEEIIGKKVNKNINEDHPINEKDIIW